MNKVLTISAIVLVILSIMTVVVFFVREYKNFKKKTDEGKNPGKN
jgi:hypothetical protein